MQIAWLLLSEGDWAAVKVKGSAAGQRAQALRRERGGRPGGGSRSTGIEMEETALP